MKKVGTELREMVEGSFYDLLMKQWDLVKEYEAEGPSQELKDELETVNKLVKTYEEIIVSFGGEVLLATVRARYERYMNK